MKKCFAVFALFFLAGLWLGSADRAYGFMKRYKFRYKEVRVGDFCVKVDGRSGIIKILRRVIKVSGENTTSNDTDSNAVSDEKTNICEEGPKKKLVTMRLLEVFELNKVGSRVGKFRPRKHHFKNFTDFRVSEVRNAVYQNLSAYQLAFASTVNGAELKVILYIFNETGNITNGDEVKPVGVGTVKFTIEINNWLFCGDKGEVCGRRKREIGSQLELALKIKGKKEKPDEDKDDDNDDNDDDDDEDDDGSGSGNDEKVRKRGKNNANKNKANEMKRGCKSRDYILFKKYGRNINICRLVKQFRRKLRKYYCRKRNNKRCGKKYDIGNEDVVVFFKQLKVDGNFTDMPDGYPRIEKRGKDYLFILRFPKGQNISYDPTIDLSPVEQLIPDSQTTSKAESRSWSLEPCFVVMFVSMLTYLLRV